MDTPRIPQQPGNGKRPARPSSDGTHPVDRKSGPTPKRRDRERDRRERRSADTGTLAAYAESLSHRNDQTLCGEARKGALGGNLPNGSVRVRGRNEIISDIARIGNGQIALTEGKASPAESGTA